MRLLILVAFIKKFWNRPTILSWLPFNAAFKSALASIVEPSKRYVLLQQFVAFHINLVLAEKRLKNLFSIQKIQANRFWETKSLQTLKKQGDCKRQIRYGTKEQLIELQFWKHFFISCERWPSCFVYTRFINNRRFEFEFYIRGFRLPSS